jgi:hypothetical protein
MNLNGTGGAAMDLGLSAASAVDDEAAKARKKKLQLQQQQQATMRPFTGASQSLLSSTGNQY